jgi:predicted membrane protein
MGWFAVLGLWRFLAVLADTTPTAALWDVMPLIIMAAVVAPLLMISAYAQARATIYTITQKRVVMRIGAALSITMNLPFVQVANADLKLFRGGIGTIAFEKMGKARVSYLICWPHVRPWYFNTRPALRCIANAQEVAELIAEHATTQVHGPKIQRAVPLGAVAAE